MSNQLVRTLFAFRTLAASPSTFLRIVLSKTLINRQQTGASKLSFLLFSFYGFLHRSRFFLSVPGFAARHDFLEKKNSIFVALSFGDFHFERLYTSREQGPYCRATVKVRPRTSFEIKSRNVQLWCSTKTNFIILLLIKSNLRMALAKRWQSHGVTAIQQNIGPTDRCWH